MEQRGLKVSDDGGKNEDVLLTFLDVFLADAGIGEVGLEAGGFFEGFVRFSGVVVGEEVGFRDGDGAGADFSAGGIDVFDRKRGRGGIDAKRDFVDGDKMTENAAPDESPARPAFCEAAEIDNRRKTFLERRLHPMVGSVEKLELGFAVFEEEGIELEFWEPCLGMKVVDVVQEIWRAYSAAWIPTDATMDVTGEAIPKL